MTTIQMHEVEYGLLSVAHNRLKQAILAHRTRFARNLCDYLSIGCG